MNVKYLFWVVYKMGESGRKRDRRTYAEIVETDTKRPGQIARKDAEKMVDQFEKSVSSDSLVSHEKRYALANSELYVRR